MTLWTLSNIERANTRAGYNWFLPHVLYVKRRIGKEIFEGAGGVFFVASSVLGLLFGKRVEDTTRQYSVHQFLPVTSGVRLIGIRNNRHTAIRYAKECSKRKITSK